MNLTSTGSTTSSTPINFDAILRERKLIDKKNPQRSHIVYDANDKTVPSKLEAFLATVRKHHGWKCELRPGDDGGLKLVVNTNPPPSTRKVRCSWNGVDSLVVRATEKAIEKFVVCGLARVVMDVLAKSKSGVPYVFLETYSPDTMLWVLDLLGEDVTWKPLAEKKELVKRKPESRPIAASRASVRNARSVRRLIAQSSEFAHETSCSTFMS